MVLAVFSCLGMTGCASKLMQPADPAAVHATVDADESAVVFFRATSFGGAIQAPVIEAAEDGALRYVAVISAKTKYLHRTTPGKHLYVVGGESGEMLEADLEAGKVSYVYVSPRMGWWKARFVFVPVPDTADETFRKDLAWCGWVQNTPEGQKWFLDNLPSLQAKYADARKEHRDAKPEEKKILKPEYGTAAPVR